MIELDVGDVVYHKITNQVFWVSGNYYVGHRESMLLNMDCVWCINKKTSGAGILIPRQNLTFIPTPNHIDSNIVFNFSSIAKYIEYVIQTINDDNSDQIFHFLNVIESTVDKKIWQSLIDRDIIVY